ncbi:hypothetical protein [Streptodolium elevatio]
MPGASSQAWHLLREAVRSVVAERLGYDADLEWRASLYDLNGEDGRYENL